MKKLREALLTSKEIVTLLHLGARAFETIGGEVVQTVAFIFRNCRVSGNAVYFRLVDSTDKENDFLSTLKDHRRSV